MAKQAHYIAWYWGGMVALCAIVVIVAALTFSSSAFLPVEALLEDMFGRADAESGFLLGVAAGPFLLTIGYSAWWGVYWLRRR